MSVTLDVRRMSRAEKLQMMETLWVDLSRDESEITSPAWHEAALRETEARFDSGCEKPVSWETAKEMLRRPAG